MSHMLSGTFIQPGAVQAFKVADLYANKDSLLAATRSQGRPAPAPARLPAASCTSEAAKFLGLWGCPTRHSWCEGRVCGPVSKQNTRFGVLRGWARRPDGERLRPAPTGRPWRAVRACGSRMFLAAILSRTCPSAAAATSRRCTSRRAARSRPTRPGQRSDQDGLIWTRRRIQR